MLKNLIKAPSRLAMLHSKQVARISELKEYVCLRESLNDQAASKAAQDFQNLASKYNLSPEDLTALFRVINSDPELLKQHVSYEAWLQDYETLKFTWRRTPFFSSGQSLQNTVQSLRSKYPEVVNFEANQPERVQAYHTLENIFVRDGPVLKSNYDNASVSRFLPEFEKRINGHINELRNKVQSKPVDSHGVHASSVNIQEGDAVNEIAKSLGRVYAKLKKDPAYVYGNIRHFVALHKQNLGELEPRQVSRPREIKSLEERSVAVARGEVTDPLELGDDLPAILAEENKEIKKGLGYNFLPWLNDRKLIFEARADRGNTLLYGALAGLFGSVLLWKIYQGDATFTNLAVVAAATAFCFGRYRTASIRNSFDYLVQMNIHRDGKTLDLFVQKANNQVSKIEGVPVSDFKIVRNDYEFDLAAPEPSEDIKAISEGRLGVRLSDLRRYGAGRGSWVATYGQDYVLVPMIHEGNHALLQQVFQGQNVEASI